MYDYNWALDHLAGGRKKYIRPLYDRGLYLTKVGKWSNTSDITVGWRGGNTYVTYHADNTTTIEAVNTPTHWGGNWNPLRSMSVRLTLARYANLEKVFIRRGQPYIMEYNSGITPPKIQGCRQCSQSGLLDKWCSSSLCWDVEVTPEATYTCQRHPDVEKEQMTPNYHRVPCEHGKYDSHQVPKGAECYFCNGTRKRDYGSKRVSLAWDGSPLKLKDGKVIKTPITDLERMVADYVRGTISRL